MHDSSSFIGWRRWNFLLSLLLLATTRGNGVADSISSEATDELSGGGGEVSCATGAVSWVAAPVSSGSSPGLAVTGALGAQPVGSESEWLIGSAFGFLDISSLTYHLWKLVALKRLLLFIS
jgi:hypothetical protein